MHSIVCNEGDETSMLVERHSSWWSRTCKPRNVLAACCERLQATVVIVGDDDSVAVVDAHSKRAAKAAGLHAFGAELEQERTIDRRQNLYAMVSSVGDDKPMELVVDRHAVDA